MTRGWDLALALDPSAREPVFLQIARAVAEGARRGRLRAGDPIPGSRSLARTLSVHRNTVLAAYRELEAEGWITTSPGRGTFVSTALPDTPPRRFAPTAAPRDAPPARPGFELRPGPEPYVVAAPLPRGTLAFAGGLPDLRLVPVAPLARAYRRALRGRGKDVLGYGDPRGHLELRSRIAAMLSAVRGLSCGPDAVLVTRGSQMALDLVARALLGGGRGEVVAIEALGYRPAWEAFRLAGARLVPLPVDASGISVEALAELAERERVRAVYVTPHHQYPTTVGLAAGRRLALLDLARRHRIAVVEDDYDQWDPLESTCRHASLSIL